MRFFWHDILQITKEIPPFLRLAVLSFTGPANSHEEFIRYNIPFPPGLMRATAGRISGRSTVCTKAVTGIRYTVECPSDGS